MSKKVSIVVINYNDKVRVQRAIDSCLNQTWKDIEVILVDDGSTKEVRDLYLPYKDKIKLVQLERTSVTERNPGRARNRGADVATGDYICFLDSDDYYDTKFVEELVKDDHPISFCDWEIIGFQQVKIKIGSVWDMSKGVLDNYLAHNHLSHSCMMIKKDLFDLVGRYDERLPLQRSEDCDLIVRLCINGSSWHYVEKNLFFVEKHETDQMKTLASIYGKTLWTLKNGMSPNWMFGWLNQNPLFVFLFNKAITDFLTDPIWEKDRVKYKEQLDLLFKSLSAELGE